MDEDKLRLIVREECDKAKVSRTFLYIMMFITMIASCDTKDIVKRIDSTTTLMIGK